MAFALGTAARAAGYRVMAHATIDSTSAEAMRLARDGDAGRLWIVACEQRQAHGRRGRAWQTPRGNLAASLLMAAPRAGPPAATLGFAAGLALDAAIRSVAPAIAMGDRLRLKWPNDVLLDGAKVAGILLEAASLPGASGGVVIGIGVNVRHAPRDLPYPAMSLAEAGADVAPEALFAALADTWVEQEALWSAGRGFASIRDRWLALAAGLGAPIAVHLAGDVVRGAFETIDDEGRLIVRERNGAARPISAGDVYFGGDARVGL